jgi:predicted RNase H-like HicB family nuclease
MSANPDTMFLLYEFTPTNGEIFLSAIPTFDETVTVGKTYEDLLKEDNQLGKVLLIAKEVIKNTPGPALRSMNMDGELLREIRTEKAYRPRFELAN